MKLGYIYELQICPPKGGNHNHALEVSKNLAERGHEFVVVDDPTNPYAQSVDSSEGDWCREFLGRVDAVMIRVDARYISESNVVRTLFDTGSTIPLFLEINSPSYETLAYSWLGGRNPWLGNRRESPIRLLRRLAHDIKSRIKTRKEESYRKEIAKRVAGAICVSSALVDYAHRLGIKNAIMIPNGGPEVRAEKRKSGQLGSCEKLNVLYAGSSIYPWQGLDILSDVIRLAEQRNAPVTFTLVINGPVKEVPSFTNVKVLSNLSREDALEQMRKADLAVALVHKWWWCPIGFYCSPIKIFEYMAMGTPVLTSKHGQMEELFRHGETAYLVENNPRKIVTLLERLHVNRSEFATVGENGRKLVIDRFNWKNVAKETEKFIAEQIVAR